MGQKPKARPASPVTWPRGLILPPLHAALQRIVILTSIMPPMEHALCCLDPTTCTLLDDDTLPFSLVS